MVVSITRPLRARRPTWAASAAGRLQVELAQLRYRLPRRYVRRRSRPMCIGQKQRWFLFRYIGSDDQVNIATEHPEFDRWQWSRADEMIASIVPFKRAVYETVVAEFRDQVKRRQSGE